MVTGHALKQRNDVPTLILGAHVQPKLGVRLVLRKLHEATNGQINALPRLIAIAVENDKIFGLKIEALASFHSVHLEEVLTVDAMRHHVARQFAASLSHFIQTELGVGAHAIPLLSRLKHFREES